MNEGTGTITAGHKDMGALAKDAGSLITATANVATQALGDVRQRAGEAAGRIRGQAVDYAKAVDRAARQHPYTVVGLALGVGALLGYLMSRRVSRNAD